MSNNGLNPGERPILFLNIVALPDGRVMVNGPPLQVALAMLADAKRLLESQTNIVVAAGPLPTGPIG